MFKFLREIIICLRYSFQKPSAKRDHWPRYLFVALFVACIMSVSNAAAGEKRDAVADWLEAAAKTMPQMRYETRKLIPGLCQACQKLLAKKREPRRDCPDCQPHRAYPLNPKNITRWIREHAEEDRPMAAAVASAAIYIPHETFLRKLRESVSRALAYIKETEKSQDFEIVLYAPTSHGEDEYRKSYAWCVAQCADIFIQEARNLKMDVPVRVRRKVIGAKEIPIVCKACCEREHEVVLHRNESIMSSDSSFSVTSKEGPELKCQECGKRDFIQHQKPAYKSTKASEHFFYIDDMGYSGNQLSTLPRYLFEILAKDDAPTFPRCYSVQLRTCYAIASRDASQASVLADRQMSGL